jgi:hypothetical protein
MENMSSLSFHAAMSGPPRLPGGLVCYLNAVANLALQRPVWRHRDT